MPPRSLGSIPVEIKILVVGFLVGIAHAVAGIAVWQEPAALTVTSLAAFHRILLSTGHLSWAAPILLAAGVMAIIGVGRVGPKARALLFLPQQCLLGLQVWAIFWVFADGKYPDGYLPIGGGWFILADQFLIWLCATSHSIWLAGLLWGGQTNGRARVS